MHDFSLFSGKTNVAGYKFCKGCGAPPAGAAAAKKEEPKKKEEAPAAAKKSEEKKEPAKKADPKKEEPVKKTEQKKEETKASDATKSVAAGGAENCLDCDSALSGANARYCLECGMRQPTAARFKAKARKHAGGGNEDIDVEKLLESSEQRIEEFSKKKSPRGEGGGAADVAKLTAEVAKWKNLFQAAAADVDEKDEILAAQMAQIEELQTLLAEKE